MEKTIEEERAKAATEIEKERQRAEAKAKEEKLAIARNFKQLGIPVADIAKATGLSTEEVERL